MLAHKYLLKTLAYDPETGLLVWRASRRKIRVGQIVGAGARVRHISVQIDGKKYLAHRLIWFYMTKRWPKHEIDHRDRNKWNNRWINLREATHGQNQANSRSRSRHKLKGVAFFARLKTRPWAARIKVKGKAQHLGYYTTKEAAHQAYCEEAKRLHGEFFNAS